MVLVSEGLPPLPAWRGRIEEGVGGGGRCVGALRDALRAPQDDGGLIGGLSTSSGANALLRMTGL